MTLARERELDNRLDEAAREIARLEQENAELRHQRNEWQAMVASIVRELSDITKVPLSPEFENVFRRGN